MIQPFQKYARTFYFRQAFRQKNRLKIALQVSKLGFSPLVMPAKCKFLIRSLRPEKRIGIIEYRWRCTGALQAANGGALQVGSARCWAPLPPPPVGFGTKPKKFWKVVILDVRNKQYHWVYKLSSFLLIEMLFLLADICITYLKHARVIE